MSTETEEKSSAPPPRDTGWFDRWFQVTARGSTVNREIRGGLTTFMAMAYIIVLNPIILTGATDVNGDTLDFVGVTTMTAFSAFVATVVMGAVGRVPLALAAALTVNAVVAYQIAPNVTWPQAMGLVVIQGLVIIVLAASGVRTMIMNAIPRDLKHAIGVGLGLFIALIGLVNSGFVSRPSGDTSVPVTLGQDGVLKGWPIAVFVIGLVIVIALWARKIPGSILLGIVVATVTGIIIESIAHIGPKGWGLVAPALPDRYAQLPDFSLFGDIDLTGAVGSIGLMSVVVFVFTLVLSGFFDAMGTAIAVSNEAGLVDRNGQMPGIGRVLSIDGAAAAFGGVTSSSANTVFVESSAGVGDGARTGLASVVTGGLFGLAMFFAPLTAVIPQQAAAPALVLVGGLMCAQARHIEWTNTEIAIPAFLILAVTPFTYSVTAGVGVGIIAYVIIKAVNGKWREPGWLLWIMSVVFVAYFGIEPIRAIFQ